MFIEFHRVKNTLIDEMAAVAQTITPGLSEQLWNIDEEGVSRALSRIIVNDKIMGIQVLDKDGKQVAQAGVVNKFNTNSDSSAKTTATGSDHSPLRELLGVDFTIDYKDEDDGSNHRVGLGIIYTGTSVVIEQVKYGFILIIINSVIKTVALWMITVYFINKLIESPLAALEQISRQLRPSTPREKVKSLIENKSLRYRKDQLGELFNSYADMHEKIRHDFHLINNKNQEIQNLNTNLEQKVEQRTTELREKIEDLKQAQEQLVKAETMACLGRLVGGVAHEINTPLGIAVTSSSFLHDELTDFATGYSDGRITHSEMEDFLQSAEDSNQLTITNISRAVALVEDFKQVAVDQSNHVSRHFNIHNLMEDILRRLESHWEATPHQVTLSCPKEITIDSSPDAWWHVLSHLITNALMHGLANKEQGNINIEVHQQNSQTYITIMDNGQGMDEETLTKAFEPFYTTRRYEGQSGLGLHLVHNIVSQTLGGMITCQSSPETGTVFKIVLPPTPPIGTERLPKKDPERGTTEEM